MNTKEVKTSIGVFELVKPKAGVRNRAVAKAETSDGNVKMTSLMMELLPKCINRRPEGVDQNVPIEHLLDSLEIEDYDLLFIELTGLIEMAPLSEEKKTK